MKCHRTIIWSVEDEVEDFFDLPSYPTPKQSKIILACMVLHNFIRENDKKDKDFERCDEDENYVSLEEPSSSHANKAKKIKV